LRKDNYFTPYKKEIHIFLRTFVLEKSDISAIKYLQMNRTPHIYSQQEAYTKLSALCATTEYCIHDIRKKLARWYLVPNEASRRALDNEDDSLNRQIGESIIEQLVMEGFVDEQRYACAFVRDKFRYNHWGRVRISMELRKRHIPSSVIDRALEEIPEEDNISTLRELISQKRRSVKGRSEYEIRGKLIRFALGRGFQMDDVLKMVEEVE